VREVSNSINLIFGGAFYLGFTVCRLLLCWIIIFCCVQNDYSLNCIDRNSRILWTLPLLKWNVVSMLIIVFFSTLPRAFSGTINDYMAVTCLHILGRFLFNKFANSLILLWDSNLLCVLTLVVLTFYVFQGLCVALLLFYFVFRRQSEQTKRTRRLLYDQQTKEAIGDL